MKISIITVCYNAESEIEATIKSVIEHPLMAYIEYIIIDGGSTDRTMDIINKYERQVSKILSEQDDGIYDAMNKGIKLATGDWILNINTGDILINIPIEKLESAVEDYYAVAGCVDSENGIIRPLYNWIIKTHNTLPHQGLFYNNRKTMMKYETYYKIVGDYNYNLKMFKENKKVLIIEDIVAYHSLSGISGNILSAKESYHAIKETYNYFYVFLSYIYRKYQAIKLKKYT